MVCGVQQFHLLIVGCLKLEELGGVVDEREDDDADDVTPSLTHVPLQSNICQTNKNKMQNTKYRNTKHKNTKYNTEKNRYCDTYYENPSFPNLKIDLMGKILEIGKVCQPDFLLILMMTQNNVMLLTRCFLGT